MMMEGGKRVYIYKPGFQTFENCIEFGTPQEFGNLKPKVSFKESSVNVLLKGYKVYKGYLYIKADFTKYKRLVFKIKNESEKQIQIGFKERHLKNNEDYKDMTKGVLISDTEEKRISFDISKTDGEQYIFIDGEADSSVDIFDIHFL
ncbi:MAG: hypothetical protein IKW45_05235 [Clostridia bacterium]|nr:hypothetical protein [Clostridia bacterium]